MSPEGELEEFLAPPKDTNTTNTTNTTENVLYFVFTLTIDTAIADANKTEPVNVSGSVSNGWKSAHFARIFNLFLDTNATEDYSNRGSRGLFSYVAGEPTLTTTRRSRIKIIRDERFYLS